MLAGDRLALLAFYVFFCMVAGSREHSWPLSSYFQALWLHFAMLGIVIAFTVLGSVVFTAPSSNTTITFILALAVLLLGRHLNKVAIGSARAGRFHFDALYFRIPHLEFF